MLTGSLSLGIMRQGVLLNLPVVTYYVSNTDGNDNNNGLTPATAWQTIAKVNASYFLPGTHILFKRGDVWRGRVVLPSSGTSFRYIKFSNYGIGNNPRILGSLAVTSWSDQGGNVWKSSSTIIDPFHTGASLTGGIFFINIDGTIHAGARKISTAALTSDYDGYWESNYLYVYSTSNPSTRYTSIESTTERGCIFMNTKENIEINGIDMFFAQYGGVYAQWEPTLANSGFIMRNCESAFHGYPNGGYGYGSMVAYSNSLFENNTIHDCGRRSISLILDRAISIVNVVIQGNNFYNGIHTTSVDIESQYAYDGYFRNIIIRNNIIDGTPVAGSSFIPQLMFVANQSTANGTISGVKIYNNLFKYSTAGGGIQIQNIIDSDIFNNTFYETYSAGGAHIIPMLGCKNINVKNNIFYTTAANGQVFYVFDTQNLSEIHSDNNLYYRTNNAYAVINTAAKNYTFAEQAAIISELGWEEHSVFANPNFVSDEIPQLQASSPAINAGVDVGLTKDIYGNSIIGLPDMGACEYGYPFVDSEIPRVTSFTIPSSSTSLTIPILSLIAMDNVAVTHYLVKESSEIPLVGDSDWVVEKPTSFTFSTVGSKTLYAWAKDAVGNISQPFKATTSIAALTDGIVGYWKFDGNANDELGLHNGTVTGATNVSGGKINNCYRFTGNPQHIVLGAVSASLNFTLMAWVKPSTIGPSNDIICSKVSGTYATGAEFRINYDGKIALFSANTAQIGASTVGVTAGVWNHVAVTYNSSGNYAFYINGSLVGSGTNYRALGQFDNWAIGRENTSYFVGDIDSVGVFNTIKSASEIAAIYAAENAGTAYPW